MHYKILEINVPGCFCFAPGRERIFYLLREIIKALLDYFVLFCGLFECLQ